MKYKMPLRKKKSDLLMRAISFAARMHDGQFRKDRKPPYISHPFRVCMTLRHVFGITDERILTAAVLHDTIEDTEASYNDLKKQFGKTIADWVRTLSKDTKRKEDQREAKYLLQLKKAPRQVKIIKLADVYDNVADARASKSKGQLRRTLIKAMKYMHVIEDTTQKNNELAPRAPIS